MKYKEWLRGIKGYSEGTIKAYSRFVSDFHKAEENIDEYIKKYQHTSNSTKRIAISALKSFLKFSGNDEYTWLELPKRDIVVSDFVTRTQYEKYMDSINCKTKMGFQKYIIVRILFETGIRSSELLSIKREDISGSRIKIQGKGKKQRYINISKWLTKELIKYTNSIKNDCLFNFTYKNLYQKIKLLDKERILTPHMFRHGYARYCFECGVSIYDISLSMGHSSIDTTARYINKKSEDVEIYNIF